MKMEITEVIEQDDDSVKVVMDMDDELVDLAISVGMRTIIMTSLYNLSLDEIDEILKEHSKK